MLDNHHLRKYRSRWTKMKTFKEYLEESKSINEIKDQHGDYEIRQQMKYGKNGNEVSDGWVVYRKGYFRPEEHFYYKSQAVKAIKLWAEEDKKKNKG